MTDAAAERSPNGDFWHFRFPICTFYAYFLRHF
jgi:hypothetical protein